MRIIYDKQDLFQSKRFKCRERAIYANKRFDDKISTSDVLNVLKRFSFKCCYCADTLNCNKWQLDHFYAKAMGGKNKIDNLAPTCNWCNTMKNALDGFAFIEKCRKVSNLNMIENEMGLSTNHLKKII